VRVLVTGGLGFVGRVVAVELVRAGYGVDVLSRGRPGTAPPAGTRLVEADLRDRARLADLVRHNGYAGVCHLAALIRSRESVADPQTYHDVNVGGTVNLLAALDKPVPFVLASTSIVYGSRRAGALSEDLAPRPETPYGATKVAAERLVRDAAGTGAVRATALRCFNIAGAVDGSRDTDPTRLIPNVLRAAYGELPHVSVNGDGSAVREYTHVRDVAVAFRLALQSPPDRYRCYNVGTGRGVSVRDVISTAEAVTGRRVPVVHLPPRPEPHTLVCDPTRITTELGWRPRHSDLAEILTDTATGWMRRLSIVD
jgi:UDP-glucose 4-epimerase